jgi:hypothetical protein
MTKGHRLGNFVAGTYPAHRLKLDLPSILLSSLGLSPIVGGLRHSKVTLTYGGVESANMQCNIGISTNSAICFATEETHGTL